MISFLSSSIEAQVIENILSSIKGPQDSYKIMQNWVIGGKSNFIVKKLKYSGSYYFGSFLCQVISDFDKTLTKFVINGEKGCTAYGEGLSSCLI